MRILLVSLMCLIFSSGVSGQSDGWCFALNLGGSWPVGEFANKSATDLGSGYSQKGFALSLDGSYALSNKVFLKGMALLNNNQVDKLGMFNQLVDRMQQYFTIETADQEFLSLSVNSWVWNGVLAGIVYTVPIGKAFWDFQVLGGLNITYLPQQKLLYQNPANNWLYLHQNLNSVSFSYGLLGGTAFRFPVANRIYFRVGVDYYNSRATTKYEEIKVTNEGAVAHTDQLSKGSTIVPIENISGTVGFVYYLN